MNSDRHDVLKAWIAAILWLIVIAIESSAMLSAHNTSRILYPLLHFLFGMDWERFEVWHFFIRKSGHVVGYGILSILLFRAWRATLPAMSNVKWTPRWATIAILGTALVASLDEWHQSFIPSRTGTIAGCCSRHVRGNRSADACFSVVDVEKEKRRSLRLHSLISS